MNNKTSIGYTLSCLGGLIVILNFDHGDNDKWGLSLAILAVVLALSGIYLIVKGQQEGKENDKTDN